MNLRGTLVACVGVAGLVAFARPAHARFSPELTSIEAGAGYTDFAKGNIKDASTGGGAAGARITIGTRSPLALEIGYLGTISEERTLQVDNHVGLATHTVEGNARVNFSLWRVQPFITGGVGWINLHSYGRDDAPIAAANFNHNDNSLVVPVGAGLAGYVGKHGLLDARFNYSFVTSKDFTPFRERPDMWNVTLNGGYAF